MLKAVTERLKALSRSKNARSTHVTPAPGTSERKNPERSMRVIVAQSLEHGATMLNDGNSITHFFIKLWAGFSHIIGT